MSSIKANIKNQEKKEESLIEKMNDSNSKSLLKNSYEDSFQISLFPKTNNRRTKIGKDLTAAYTAKFVNNNNNNSINRNTLKRNRTLTFNEDKEKDNDIKFASSASETELSLKNLEHKFSKKKLLDGSIKSKDSSKIEKTLVDNIEHIYSKIKKTPTKIILQNFFIYLVALLVGIYDWNFLFQSSENKLERNYCFSNLYQFDSCSIEQICKNYNSKLNYIIYNKDINKNGDKSFIEERDIINSYYKHFFMKYSYELSYNQLLNSYQIFSSNRDKSNFAIILTSKNQWNYFLRYYSVCQKKSYLLMIIIVYIAGGIFGAIIFGLQADLRGRKKIIRINLLILLIGFIIILFYFYYLDGKYIQYKKDFKKKYKYSNQYSTIQYDNILEDIYSQNLINKLFNKTFIIFLMGILITNLAACPLLRTSLSLLIENATNDHLGMKNFRKYNFFLRGISPILSCFFIININSTIWTNTFLCFYVLLLFISSFFILNESMRYLYEYCEWSQLSEFIKKNFVLEEEKDIQLLNNIELKIIQRNENEIINKEYENRRLNLKAEKESDDIFEKNNFYNYYKRKKSFLIRGIRRRAEIIIKYKEIIYNPSILIICLKANRHFVKKKYSLISILIMMNFFLFILEQEMIKKPFFREKDLLFSKKHNYLFNSNFFGLCIITYLSNLFYYYLYRISCFKIVIVISYIFLSFLSFIYYIHSLNSNKTPLYLSQYNFGMMNYYYRDYYILNQFYLHAMYFAINGIYFYIHIFLIKISKTLYRCIVFSIHSILILISLILVEIFNTEIKKPFLLLGFINILCLIIILFLNEMNDLPNLVNDLKKIVEKVKHSKNE